MEETANRAAHGDVSEGKPLRQVSAERALSQNWEAILEHSGQVLTCLDQLIADIESGSLVGQKLRAAIQAVGKDPLFLSLPLRSIGKGTNCRYGWNLEEEVKALLWAQSESGDKHVAWLLDGMRNEVLHLNTPEGCAELFMTIQKELIGDKLSQDDMKAWEKAAARAVQILHRKRELRDQRRSVGTQSISGETPRSSATTQPAEKESRIWTEKHCPSCGLPGITFVGQKEFSEETGISGKTIRNRITSGKYWHNGLGELPFCPVCRENTPLGPGKERRVDGLPVNVYQPKNEELMTILTWVGQVLPRLSLPQIEPNRRWRKDASRRENEAVELRNEGARAVQELIKRTNQMPAKDEAQGVALTAMKDFRRKDYQSRKKLSRDEAITQLWPDSERPAEDDKLTRREGPEAKT